MFLSEAPKHEASLDLSLKGPVYWAGAGGLVRRSLLWGKEWPRGLESGREVAGRGQHCPHLLPDCSIHGLSGQALLSHSAARQDCTTGPGSVAGTPRGHYQEDGGNSTPFRDELPSS